MTPAEKGCLQNWKCFTFKLLALKPVTPEKLSKCRLYLFKLLLGFSSASEDQYVANNCILTTEDIWEGECAGKRRAFINGYDRPLVFSVLTIYGCHGRHKFLQPAALCTQTINWLFTGNNSDSIWLAFLGVFSASKILYWVVWEEG